MFQHTPTFHWTGRTWPRTAFACLWVVATFVGGCTAAAGENSEAYVRRTDTELTVGNAYVELQIDVAQNRAAAKCLVNKLTGQSLPLRADSFSLGLEGSEPLRAADFALRDVRERNCLAAASGSCCNWRATGTTPRSNCSTRWAIATSSCGGKSCRRRNARWRCGAWTPGSWGSRARRAPGLRRARVAGRHVLGTGVPGAQNPYADGMVKLTHYPGRTVTDRFVSKTAVLGVAAKGAWLDSSSDTSRRSRRRRKPSGCSSTTTPGGR